MIINDYDGDGLYSSDGFKHYGVKGMKWGVRKSRTSGGSRKRRLSRNTKKPKKKKVSEMTDAELDAVIRRKNKEKQYKEATQPAALKYAKKAGKTIVGGVLFGAGKKVLTSYASDYMKSVIGKGVEYVKNKRNAKIVTLAIVRAVR